MEGQRLIYDDMKLFITPEHFYLEPSYYPTEVMVIDRNTARATVETYGTVKIPVPTQAYRPVCGFLGSIRLISGYYLIVVKYRVLIGKINGNSVYRLHSADFIPYAKSTTHLTAEQVEENSAYERLLAAALETPGMYFSYGHDMTHTFQRLHSMAPDFQKMSLLSRADPRFLWNGYLLKDFTADKFSKFALPLIQGFVSINRVLMNGSSLQYSLVSRRSVERAGTRLFMRGADAQGHVANYVETEQIVERGVETASYVQVRGSIPLYWTQLPNIKYKPAIDITADDHVAAYTAHMRDQVNRYGSAVLVNLIDSHGREQQLGEGFRAAVAAAAIPGVRYEYFDFHTECRKMRYDRLQVLMDRIAHEQDEFNYFLSRGGSVLLKQTGVFRTNCIDCLDRTNVVQSLMAKRNLVTVLKLLTVGQDLDESFRKLFNNVWADHADMISVQYSGTGALKTDFTRTGQRTKYGLLCDGINSLTRYYKNNFSDGFRQDSIDLILGKYVVVEGEGITIPCPLRRDRNWKTIAFPSVLLIAISMFVATAALPQQYTNQVLLYLIFWGATVGATLNYIIRNGRDFVDWPRLEAGGLAARAQPPPSL